MLLIVLQTEEVEEKDHEQKWSMPTGKKLSSGHLEVSLLMPNLALV